MSRVGVVLPAGGSGQRMGGVAKPLLPLAGRPILERALEPFLARADVVAVAVVLPASLHAEPPAWLLADDRIRIGAGGAHRTDSVRSGLALLPEDLDVVLVHDAARPLVSAAIVERCITAAAAGRSVIAAVAVVDTIQEVDPDGVIVATPDRDRLRAAQTPQAFPAAVIRLAHARAGGETATDDAALVTRLGERVGTVDGSPRNLKITTPADLALAEALLAAGGDSADTILAGTV